MSSDRTPEILALCREGLAVSAICERLHLHHLTVKRALAEHGREPVKRVDRWPSEKVAELTRMWLAGSTATEIGVAIGVTRNAVIGKVQRLGLQRDPILTAINHKRNSKKQGGNSPVLMRGVSAARKIKERKSRAKPKLVCVSVEDENVPTKTLMEMGPRECRWPIGDAPDGRAAEQRFCGGKTLKNCTYCTRHGIKAYDQDTKKRSEDELFRSVRRWAA